MSTFSSCITFTDIILNIVFHKYIHTEIIHAIVEHQLSITVCDMTNADN